MVVDAVRGNPGAKLPALDESLGGAVLGLNVLSRALLNDEKDADADGSEVRSIHWSPYDPVGVVNADP